MLGTILACLHITDLGGQGICNLAGYGSFETGSVAHLLSTSDFLCIFLSALLCFFLPLLLLFFLVLTLLLPFKSLCLLCFCLVL